MAEQRVQYKDHGLVGSGVVREQKDGKTLVYWGTSDNREFSNWVDDSELEAYSEPVWAGDPETRKREKVYDPDVNPWQPSK